MGIIKDQNAVILESNTRTCNTDDGSTSEIRNSNVKHQQEQGQNLALVKAEENKIQRNLVVYDDVNFKNFINSEKEWINVVKEKSLDELRDNKCEDVTDKTLIDKIIEKKTMSESVERKDLFFGGRDDFKISEVEEWISLKKGGVVVKDQRNKNFVLRVKKIKSTAAIVITNVNTENSNNLGENNEYVKLIGRLKLKKIKIGDKMTSLLLLKEPSSKYKTSPVAYTRLEEGSVTIEISSGKARITSVKCPEYVYDHSTSSKTDDNRKFKKRSRNRFKVKKIKINNAWVTPHFPETDGNNIFQDLLAGNVYDSDMWKIKPCYEKVNVMTGKHYKNYDLAMRFEQIQQHELHNALSPVIPIIRIVWVFFTELSKRLEYSDSKSYSLTCMIRYIDSSLGLSSDPQFKMLGCSEIITGDRGNWSELAFDLAAKLIASINKYCGTGRVDLIMCVKPWLSNDDYIRIKANKNLDKKDVGKIINNVYKNKKKKVNEMYVNIPKQIQSVTVDNFVKNTSGLSESVGIDLNTCEMHGFIKIDNKNSVHEMGNIYMKENETVESLIKDFNNDWNKGVKNIDHLDRTDCKNIKIDKEYYVKEVLGVKSQIVVCEKNKFTSIDGKQGVQNVFGEDVVNPCILRFYGLNVNQSDFNSTIKSIIERGEFCIDNGVQMFKYSEWMDKNNHVVRGFHGSTISYNDIGKSFKLEIEHKTPRFKQIPKDREYIDKIGTIDLETYLNDEGVSVVYSACSVVGEENCIILEYGDKGGELVYNLFNRIFDHLNESKAKERVKYFYAHNGSNFDFIFILKALSKYDEYTIKPILKESSQIMELKVTKTYVNVKNNKSGKKNTATIILRDSILYLNQPLAKLSQSYLGEDLKGLYPYKFVNKNTIQYIGSIPDFEYFNLKNCEEDRLKYQNLVEKCEGVYNLQAETEKYIISDCVILFKIMHKFKEMIYKLFEINVEKTKTAPGLALNIFLSNFYKQDMDLRVVKGDIERNIRQSYYGGFACVYEHKFENVYHYDMNSQYPFVMLNDMPVGNPVFSTDTKLDEYFGFVYAEVCLEKSVKTPILYHKDNKGNSKLDNSKNFKSWFFSEELKYAVQAGYTVKILGGYKFKRNPNVFKDYVNTLYDLKKKAELDKNIPQRQVVKLLLVSLFGRMGQKEIYDKIVIVSKDEADTLIKTRYYSKKIELDTNKYLVVHQGYIDTDLLDLLDITKDEENPFTRTRGVLSSVSIASCITAYGRMSISKYLLMDNLKVYYIVTDGITVDSKLPDELVSNELGAMKLEYEIKNGIIISVNTLAIKTPDGKEIIKCKGFNSKNGYIVQKNSLDKTVKLGYNHYEELLKGKDIKLAHEVWSSSLEEGTVKIREQEYTLRGVSLK